MEKNKFIETENVFIDSSVFEEQNFLNGTKIHSLFHYSQEGAIKIHVTSISKMELYNRIDKRFELCKSELKKIEKGFDNKNIRILKNLRIFKTIVIPEILPASNSTELKEKVDNFFKVSNVNTIHINNLPIFDIVSNYYNKKPPFHNSGKQNEFIDALILSTLEKWCTRTKTKMYVLSKDQDFLGYKSKFLLMEDDISSLLEKISRFYDQQYKLNKISSVQKIIKKNREGLESLAKEIIYDKVSIKGENCDIKIYSIERCTLNTHKVISFRNDRTEIECIFQTLVSLFIIDDHEYKGHSAKNPKIELMVPIYAEINNNSKIDLKQILDTTEFTYINHDSN